MAEPPVIYLIEFLEQKLWEALQCQSLWVAMHCFSHILAIHSVAWLYVDIDFYQEKFQDMIPVVELLRLFAEKSLPDVYQEKFQDMTRSH